jgi:general secretion pathway protein E
LGAPLELPNGSRINFRIECQSVQLPTEKSQAFCFRPQDSSKVAKGKMPLPFDEPLLSQVRFALSKDQGILLTTGPTGSGKTTTLHACLSELDAVRTNIRTVEDPVEYTVRDYGQIPVGLAASKDGALTPLKALHSNLRFKPSTILMGEIRSLEVAQVTFEAALTGHRLMATLHTDDALGAIPRLLHLEGKGIDASILSQTVRLILAQRMVRLLCDNCKIPESITPLMREHFEFYHLTVPSKLHRRGGCAACKNTGYSGRKPIFEGVLFDEGMRRIVADPKGFDKLAARKHWRECQRAKPLGQAGLELVACGRAAYNDVAGYDNIFEPKGLFESEPSNGPG